MTAGDKEKASVAGVKENQWWRETEDLDNTSWIYTSKTSRHRTLQLHQKQLTHELLLQN